jgi:hypothetical protein
MTIKERLRNPFVQQYLLEILLPIAGYYLFDWSLVIIAVFYLIDQIGAEYSFVRKLKAISKSENKSSVKYSLIAILFFLIMISAEIVLLYIYFGKGNMQEEQSMINELILFAKEELWILVPLIILMYHLKDQFTFFMPRRYLQKDTKKFFAAHLVELSLITVSVFVGTFVFSNLTIPDPIILFSFLTIKLIFDFTVGKLLEKKTTK